MNADRSTAAAEALVRRFWAQMASNDFQQVKAVLSADFVLEWAQSNERIRGPERFAQMNAEYPASGRWSFSLEQLVA